MTDKKKKDKMITLTELKKRYGITDKLVKEFFKDPDEYVTNPFYKNAAPMKLYNEKRINRIIKTKKFEKAFNESIKRKDAARKAVQTKIEKTMSETKKKIKKIQVTVLDISDNELRNMAIKSYIEFKEYRDMMYDNYYSDYYDAYNADSETIDRWTVNYIRHNLTEYDHELYNMAGSVGIHDAYTMYKEAVLKKIGKAYPNYKKECKRQINMMKGLIHE